VSRLCGFVPLVGVSRFELEASWSRNISREIRQENGRLHA
jgi:hypothetical protein